MVQKQLLFDEPWQLLAQCFDIYTNWSDDAVYLKVKTSKIESLNPLSQSYFPDWPNEVELWHVCIILGDDICKYLFPPCERKKGNFSPGD